MGDGPHFYLPSSTFKFSTRIGSDSQLKPPSGQRNARFMYLTSHSMGVPFPTGPSSGWELPSFEKSTYCTKTNLWPLQKKGTRTPPLCHIYPPPEWGPRRLDTLTDSDSRGPRVRDCPPSSHSRKFKWPPFLHVLILLGASARGAAPLAAPVFPQGLPEALSCSFPPRRVHSCLTALGVDLKDILIAAFTPLAFFGPPSDRITQPITTGSAPPIAQVVRMIGLMVVDLHRSGATEGVSPTTDEAHDLFLQGMSYLYWRGPNGLFGYPHTHKSMMTDPKILVERFPG